MITTPGQAVEAATCALSSISSFRSTTGHRADCAWCKHDPRDLCRMVADYLGSPEHQAAIRLYEAQASQNLMESMWQS